MPRKQAFTIIAPARATGLGSRIRPAFHGGEFMTMHHVNLTHPEITP
ncbi:MAG: hypothetical protein LBE33_08960 [Zoogloeaceae bacterium]|jgi:hypothetical protein|nr:hypothetical protein [Zoogloeaceae bacterium]